MNTIGTLDNRALAQPVTSFTITVSRPLPVLRSNGGHGNRWAVAAARRDAREEAGFITVATKNKLGLVVPSICAVNISYTEILGPRERAMDDDNLIAAMKSTRDGIALALGINDKRMRVQPCGACERGDASAVVVRCWWTSEVGT